MVRINRETTWYPWVCWLIAASVFLVQYGLLVFPSAITQPLEKSLSIDSTEIGVFYSAFLYTYILMQIPAGFLFDRYSAKKLLMFASAMMAAGCISLIYSGSFLTGIISRMLMGFGGSFAFVGAIYLGREWFSVLMFPVVVGLTEAMSGVGTVGFSSIFSIASTHQKWQTTLAGITIFIIIQIILIKIFVTDKHSKGGYKYSKDTLIHHAALVFKNPTIWLTAIYIGFGFAHYMTLTNLWRLSFLKHQFHIPISYAILENSLVVVGYIIGGPLCGYLSRFFDNRHIMMAGILFQVIFLMYAVYIHITVWDEGVALLGLGLATGSIILSFNVIKKEVPKSIYGMACGMISMFFGGFSILLSPLVGYLYKASSENIQIAVFPIILCSSLAVLVCFALLLIKKKRRSFHEEIFKKTPCFFANHRFPDQLFRGQNFIF